MSNKTESKTSSETEKTNTSPREHAKKWNFGGVFWGLFIILIGVLLLLENFKIVDVNFANLWRLWPVLIIGLGLSLLSLRGWFGALVSFLAAVILLGLVALTVIDNPIYPGIIGSNTQTITQTEFANGAKSLQVTTQTGAANITLSSSRQQHGVEAVQKSNRPTLTKTAETIGDSRHVTFSTKSAQTFWFNGSNNDIALNFTQSTPLSLVLETGATSITGDLSKTKLTSLAIKTGASEINLRLGSVQKQQEITINAGASDITFHIPKEAGVQIKSDSALTETHFEGVDKISDSLYESPNFSEAKSKIIINAGLGVSRFAIEQY